MRKILLTLLCVSLVCASAFAFWNPFNRSTKPTFNEAELHATLAELAPTEAEAEAIAALRKKSSVIQRAMQPKEFPLILPSDLKLPVEAEPVDDDSVQFAIEYKFLSGPESFVKTVTGHPAMEWSALPVATPFANTSTPPGTFSRSVSVQMPIHVRYLENDKLEKIIKPFMSHRTTSIMELPKLMLANGQEGTVSDVTQIPFVTSVSPIEADGAIGYQPVITIIGQGMTTTTKVTLLQDGSCRLASRVEFTSVGEVNNYRLIDGGDEVVNESRLGLVRSTIRNGITIQVPSLHTFSVNIPDIVIPDGMSLLVAFPGDVAPPGNNSNEPGGAFMLITPTKGCCEGHVVRNQGKLTREVQSLETPAEQETVEPKSFTFGIRYVR